MRLWHYKLLPFLPNSQLVAQWRELNSIFKNQPKHILINYVYEYPKDDLLSYSIYVLKELDKRGYVVNGWKNFDDYFGIKLFDNTPQLPYPNVDEPFKHHHTDRYLKQCFYNLQEKYDRGQADFNKERYTRLEDFIRYETNII